MGGRCGGSMWRRRAPAGLRGPAPLLSSPSARKGRARASRFRGSVRKRNAAPRASPGGRSSEPPAPPPPPSPPHRPRHPRSGRRGTPASNDAAAPAPPSLPRPQRRGSGRSFGTFATMREANVRLRTRRLHGEAGTARHRFR